MEKLIDIVGLPAAVTDTLLADISTKENIIWATDTYEELGDGFADTAQMNAGTLIWNADLIQPRIQKSLEAQAQRTRKKAEVFTPAWLCNKMNNHCDEEWFERENVFNCENSDNTWIPVQSRIEFPEGRKWQQYVDSRRLEITCGEAPYLASRYDVSTGEVITPLTKRIGLLDRKLRVVSENAADDDEWLNWSLRALQSVYGYEYQGDNLLIARINILNTFCDYYEERFKAQAGKQLLKKAAKIIARNIWQMDGLKGTVPLGKPYEEFGQMSLFDELEETPEREAVPCMIYDWRSKVYLKFNELREMQTMGKKMFDYVIGNPPYNEDFENSGDNGNFAKPVYNYFMEAAYTVSDKVELITPARFLFNAGSTPKEWNNKMLNDEHFKVLSYVANSALVFQNTDVKGGIAISYRDETKSFGAIKTFTAFPELNGIINKAAVNDENNSIASIVYTQIRFDLDVLYGDYPEYRSVIGSDGKDKRFRNNVFEKIKIFKDISENDNDIKVLGILKNKRTWRYISQKYVDMSHENISKWKVLVPRANGSGALGEVLSTPLIGEPLIGEPLIGYTQSFIGIGAFDTEYEAIAAIKYVKTKFARTILGVLKVTQDNDRGVWKLIPLQDFTENSDIDWSKPVAYIDKQLYRKYGLTQEEIDFIETHVKEMA